MYLLLLLLLPTNTHSLHIHVVGMAGHGKSALVSALAGDGAVLSGNVETTMERTGYYLMGDCILYDYPGFGTPRFPIRKWLGQFPLPQTGGDVIMLVVGPRLYEQHAEFLSAVHPTIIVRTQVDLFPISKEEFIAYWNQQGFPYPLSPDRLLLTSAPVDVRSLLFLIPLCQAPSLPAL